MDAYSSWPLSHAWIGGTDHLAYYRLPGWFREACLLPEGQQHQAKSNCITPLTPPLPPLSPVSASLQLPSVCWISHTKTQPWGIWTRAPASPSDCMGLHITSRCILVIDFLISLCTLYVTFVMYSHHRVEKLQEIVKHRQWWALGPSDLHVAHWRTRTDRITHTSSLFFYHWSIKTPTRPCVLCLDSVYKCWIKLPEKSFWLHLLYLTEIATVHSECCDVATCLSVNQRCELHR